MTMELFDIYRRRSLPDKKVTLRQPLAMDMAAQSLTDCRLLIVRDGQWVRATREEFDKAITEAECKMEW
jgi:predicted membrane-bound spermidine synthase